MSMHYLNHLIVCTMRLKDLMLASNGPAFLFNGSCFPIADPVRTSNVTIDRRFHELYF